MSEEKRDGIKAHKARIEQRERAMGRKSYEERKAAYRKKRRRKRQIQKLILLAVLILILMLLFFGCRAVVRGITGSDKKEQNENEQNQTTELQVEGKGDAESKEATAVITTAGDIVMHRPFLESSVYKTGDTYDYNSIFKYIKDDYNAADFTVLTTEFTMTDSEYTGYPMFNSPPEIVSALKNNGIDMCLLGNNHIYDSGDDGLLQTIEVYEENDLLYNGIRKTEDENNYVVKDIGGIKVGFFDYVFETEGETINGNYVSEKGKALINSFSESDPQKLYDGIEKNLKKMEDEGVEYTIVYLHWGVEYQTKENEYQDAIAQKLCDMGIDALIASHPHVIQPVDLLTSSSGDHQMLCCYAIGNHLSNQRTEYMDGLVYGYSEDGLIVSLTLHRDKKGQITLEKTDFIPTWVYHNQSPDDTYYILPLDNPDEIKSISKLGNISEDVDESLARTDSIIGDGVKKIQAALPLKQ
ncbi:MAG: CapA family protein [Eubacteriales bacterium]|nr:CapA family protein [Eubacteriales bacterium]